MVTAGSTLLALSFSTESLDAVVGAVLAVSASVGLLPFEFSFELVLTELAFSLAIP